MTKMEYYMVGIPPEDMKKLKEQHPEICHRGGIQEFLRELVRLSLQDNIVNTYIEEAVDLANMEEESVG